MITKAIYMFKMMFIQENMFKITSLILIKAQDHIFFFFLFTK